MTSSPFDRPTSDMGYLVDDAVEVRDRVRGETSGSAGAWEMSLTATEGRVLSVLAAL
jgi:hypothetical protein